MPSLWLSAVSANVDDMIRVFRAMAPHAQRQTLHPADYGLKRIGHMGFFQPGAQAIWPVMVQWLERHAH